MLYVSTVMLFGDKKPVRFDGCEVYTWIMISSTVFNPILVLVSLYGLDPLNTRYLYHFLSTESRRTWLFWLWGLVEYIGHLSFFSPWVLVLILVWIYSKSTTFWLRQMRYLSLLFLDYSA